MAIIRGTNGNDNLNGTDEDDLILGRRGDDRIRGGAGDDVIIAGRGDDIVDGGDGEDIIIAGRGDDIVDGGADNDIIIGDRGNDTLRGGSGDDIIDGGRGNDTMDGEDGSDTYQVGGRRDGFDEITDTGTGADDYDVIEATSNNTRIQMRDFDSSNGIEEISGNGYANVDIRGDNGDNTFDFSNTTLSGIREIDLRAGDDSVTGSAGDDNIDGGRGFDTVFYSGSIDDYDIQRSGATTTVTGDGIDTLNRVELVQFNDYALFIDGRNNGPVAGDDAVSADEDTGATISVADLIANDKDYDGDTLSFDSIDTTGTLGSVTVNSDGTLSYDPNGAYESLAVGETATDSFTYTISDGQGGFATGTVSVTVNGANDGPTAADDVGAVDETGVYYVPANGVLSNDSDPDSSDTLSVGAVEGETANVGQQITLDSGAILTMRADGSYDYDPNGAFDYLASGETATDSFTYTVTDGHGVASVAAEPVQRTLIDESFEGGAGGFAYSDDTFRGTGEPAYADGASGAGFGDGSSGGLQVTLGGQDNADILGMSGGWTTTIDVPEDAAGTLTFKYNLTLAENYESDEFAQVMLSVDGNPVGANGADFVAQLTGDGNGGPVMTTGWQTVTIDLGQLSAGSHTITIGGYSNKKTYNDESAEILIDDVQLTTDSTPMIETSLLDEGFDGGAGGFAYVDDAFRGTSEADYADGAWGAGFGETGGGLQITLGGQDGADILGMSGGWQTTINVPEDASGTLTFKYNMTLAPNFESDEFGQVMVSIDGTLYGTGGNDHVVQLNGDGNGGAPTTTGWQTFTVNLADLPAGDHTLVIGGYSNKKTFADESIEILIDDVQFTTSTPDPDANGPETATVTVTVTGTNDDPVAQDDTGEIGEDDILTVDATGVLANDSDVNGDSLSVGEVEGDSANVGNPVMLGSGAIVTMLADGSYTYDTNSAFDSLPLGQSVTDTFSYTVSDGAGGSDTATVTITINGANDAPDATDDSVVVGEDDGPSVGNLLANDTDVDTANSELRVTSVETAAGVSTDLAGGTITIELGIGGAFTVSADGTCSYDPQGDFEALAEGEQASEIVTYTVSDGQGGFTTAMMTVTVTGTNDAPVAAMDSLTVGEDDGATSGGNLLDNDSDVDTPQANLEVSAVETASGASTDLAGGTVVIDLDMGGQLTVSADGTYSFDPNGAFESLGDGDIASETVTYTVSDGQGGTDTASVVISVTGTNDAPVTTVDTLTVGEDAPLFVPSTAGVLANDSDPEGDALTLTEFAGQVPGSFVQLPSGAFITTTDSDGNFNFFPVNLFTGDRVYDYLAEGETATETISYEVADSNGATSMGTLEVTIVGANDGPVAQDDSLSVDEDSGATAGVNLTDNDTDIDLSDSLSISMVGSTAVDQTAGQVTQIDLPSGAILNIDADGNYTYDPNGAFDSLDAGETAQDLITYTVSDGIATSTATLTVTITGVDSGNGAPIAVNDTLTVEEGVMVDVNGLLDNDIDPDGDPLTVTHINGDTGNVGGPITLPSGAVLNMASDGTYTYDPNNAFNSLAVGETAIDSFTYTATDSFGATDTATLTITINGANDAPVAADDDASVGEDDAVAASGNLLGNDSDVDASDVLSVTDIGGTPVDLTTGATITLANGAELVVGADGSYSFSPNGGYESLADGETATETFVYTIDDGNGGSDTATLTVTITGANDGPVAVDDALSVGEDDTVATSGNLLGNDGDVDGDALSVTDIGGTPVDPTTGATITLANGAELVVGADGSYSFSPNGGYESLADGETATETFTYTTSDGNGGASNATLTVTITGANDGPVAVDDALSVGEEDTVATSGNLLGNDSDVDASDVLSVTDIGGTPVDPTTGATITLANGAELVVGADGSYSFNPNGGYGGLSAGETATETFTYTVDDGNGGTSSATLTVTINGDNASPVAVNDAVSVGEDDTVATSGNLLGNDSDADGDALSVTDIGGTPVDPATGATITLANGAELVVGADGSYSFSPNGGYESLADGETATETFVYTASDGNGGASNATLTVTITGANDGPVAVDDAVSVGEDDTVATSGNLLGNDSDVDASDVLSVTDIGGTPVDPTVGATITLANGAELVVGADGSYSFSPNGGYESLADGETATETFTYTMDDGNGGADTATLTVTITGANDGPVAVDDALSVGEDDTVATSGNLLGNDSDVDGDALSVTDVGGTPVDPTTGATITLANGAELVVGADGSYSFSPNGGYEGLADGETATETFVYTMDDGNGGADTATLTVTITGANDGPVAVDDAVSVGEDDTVATSGNLLGNDSDVDGDALSVTMIGTTAVDPTTGATITLANGAELVVGADGSYSFSPNGGYESLADGETATESFVYTMDDGNGGSDSATLTVTITGANDGPVAVDDAVSVGEDDTVATSGNLLGNDSDVDGDALSVTMIGTTAVDPTTGATVTLANGAELVVGADGSYSFSPNGGYESLAAGETATETFVYTMDDGNGGSDSATLTVTITGANDGPVAVDDAVSVGEDDTVAATGNLLGNDSDVDASDVLSVTDIGGTPVDPTLGATVTLANGAELVVGADGSYSFSPNGGYESLADGETATETFVYTMDDGNGGSDTATLTVTITGANDGPVAVDDALSVGEDDTVATSGNLLGNDSDVDGDVLSVTDIGGTPVDPTTGATITLANGAELVVGADGSYSFSPNGGYESLADGETATETFVYTMDDGNGGTDSATLTVTITGANDGPVAVDDAVSVGEDDTVAASGNLLGNDSDVDASDVLSVTDVAGTPVDPTLGATITLANGAELVVSADGSYSFSPNGGYESLADGETATETFVYTMDDGNGGADTATLTVTITGANDGPVAVDDALSVGEDDTVATSGNLLGNDSDVDASDVLSVTDIGGTPVDPTTGATITLANGAELVVGADGSYSFSPNGGYEGLADGETATETFVYTMDDGNGGADTATLTVTITGANDGPVAVDDAVSVGEDDTVATSGNLLGNDGDTDSSDVLSVTMIGTTAVDPTTGATITLANGAELVVGADGSYSFSPNGGYESLAVGETATETFTYTVDDGNGGASNATLTVTITGANDGPVAVDDALGVSEDAGATAGNLVTNDGDADASDVLSVTMIGTTAVDPTTGATITLANGAELAVGADGSYSFNPNGGYESLAAGETATETFTYTVDDGNGGISNATLTVTITGVNDGPVAVDDALSVGEDDGAVAGTNLLSNDSDIDGTPAGLSLTMIGTTPVDPTTGATVTLANGAVVIAAADGSYSFNPNGGYESLAVGETATETFTYTVSDGNGGTDTGMLTVTITGANDGPVAVDDALSVSEDAGATAGNLVTNDGDVDGDILSVTMIGTTPVDPTTGATVTLANGAELAVNADGSYSFNPNGNYQDLAVGETATETFTYTVDDGNSATDTATLTVTITGANDGPVAVGDAGTTAENVVLSVPANGVLGNDSDPDGDVLTVTAVEGSTSAVGNQITLTSGALLTMDQFGGYSYDPNGQFQALMDGESATDTFTYTVDDGNGGTDIATVTITITGVSNSSPIATDDAAATTEDDALVVDPDGVLSNDSDPDGDVLTVSQVEGSAGNVGNQITLASGALLTMNADGTYTYDPNGAYESLSVGETALDTFTYTVDDGNGATDTATVTVTVNGVNDAPVAVSDTFVVRHDDNTEVETPTFLDNDFDPEDGASVTLVSIDGTPVDFSGGSMDVFLANGDIVSFNPDLSFFYVLNDPAAGDLLFGESITTGPIQYVIEDSAGVQTTGSITYVVANATFNVQDLDGTNGFVVNGVASQDLAGHSVSGAGDVNGDGYDDFIVGAFQANPSTGADAGTSYVVFGGANGPVGGSLDLSSLNGTNGFAINGTVANQFIGRSVSAAGDVNGDGFDDVLVGMRDESDGGVAGSESAYVVYGTDAGFAANVDLSSLNGSNGFTITGIDANFSDIVVSSAGDVNGDGIDDMVIGSQGAGTSNVGSSYVVFGQAGGFGSSIDVSTLNGTNGFSITGVDATDNLGFAVTAGDLNNDGYDDVIVGAVGGDPGGVNNAGEVYVVYGGASGLPSNVDASTLNGTNGFVITGAVADGVAGNSVSSAGDINGDGIDDLVIGERGFYYDTGGAYVVFGQDGGLGTGVDLGTLDGTNGFRIVGNEQGDQAGYSVAMAGDINGDGFDDIVVGARGVYGYDEYGYSYANFGESYVIFGSASGFAATLDLNQLDGQNGFVIGGAPGEDTLGNSVSSAGDVNGDGYDDLIVGAPKTDANGNDSGASYILYGQDFQGNVTHQGTSAADTLTGDAGANTMIGGQGNDFLFGAGGMDVLYGGEGDDTLRIADLAPQRIDGGTGTDTLQIEGASLAVDLGDLPISSIEAVEFSSGSADNVLTLNVMDVLDASDSTNTLKVLGDLGDQVVAEGGWTSAGQQVDGGVTFDVYTSGEATLMVESDLNNNVVIV